MTNFVLCRRDRLPLAFAFVAACAIAPVAFAQNVPAPASTTPIPPANQTTTTQQQKAAQQKAQQLQSVTVTGSLIQMPENESVAPVQTVNVQAKIATGSFDTANVLMGTAIASGSTEINGQFGGFIVNGGTGIQSVNLRGLGPGRTLVLLDGQRPGPAGVRGQVSAFDLNVIPVSIIQRIDIVKDGSSSIYGSDAIAGVVNIITKKNFEHPEMDLVVQPTEHGGGTKYRASFTDGWNFQNGNILLALQADRRDALEVRQRSFLSCTRDRVWANGKRADLPDHSINQGTKYAGCDTLWINSYINLFNGNYLVPASPGNKGAQPSIIPGYVIRRPIGFDPSQGEVPYLQEQTDAPFMGSAYAIDQLTRYTAYFASNLSFGNIGWDTEFLYNYRQTKDHQWRQFFPGIWYPYGSNADTAQALLVPIMPYPANTNVKDDYFYGATKLTGILPWTNTWTWEGNLTYTKSAGTYVVDAPGIDCRISGDHAEIPACNTVLNPPIDLTDPGFISGAKMQQLIDTYALDGTGHTTFTQETANLLFTGNLFHWWAGDVKAAFGGEVRYDKLLDQPNPDSQKGYQWGLTSAGVTTGSDTAKEIFAQLNVPLVADVPGIQKLGVDLSGREFRYNAVGSYDNVWRVGLNWQITPTIRVRGTLGTSYKAPALFQLYLADQTGFLAQASIDPCSQWGQSTNQFIRTNCAAAGIPADYNANSNPSATIHSGGGKGFLFPETSRAKSVGVVWTPTFANMMLSLDYFDYNIHGEITQLSGSTIVFGCYGRAVYPNDFCKQLDRNAPDAAVNPNMITNVFATYTNINRERTRGYDLFGRFGRTYSFGHLGARLDVVYTLDDVTQLFSTAAASGFTNSDRIGYIGNPRTVAILDASWSRGDWSIDWEGRYFSSTYAKDAPLTYTYYGDGPVVTEDKKEGWQIRQSVSATYSRTKWAITAGIRNLFDKKPDVISAGTGYASRGQVSISASQYDWFGRTFFAHLRYRF